MLPYIIGGQIGIWLGQLFLWSAGIAFRLAWLLIKLTAYLAFFVFLVLRHVLRLMVASINNRRVGR